MTISSGHSELPEPVTLSGFGARVLFAGPTFVTTLGNAAERLRAAPTDLVTVCWRSGAMFNGFIHARINDEPRFNAARPALGDAGIETFGRGPDLNQWRVSVGDVDFPLVALLMYVAGKPHPDPNVLPVQFLFGAYPNTPEPYDGAADTMITIAGPFDSVPPVEAVSAGYQRVVERNLDSAPFWVENAYTHAGLEWRQRVYWAMEPTFLISYQAPASRGVELERLRAAAVEIAHGIRLKPPAPPSAPRERGAK
jgi:hypothetical protein